MKIFFKLLLPVFAMLMCDHAALASKPVANRAYVQSGPDGVFYARCIPAADRGSAGVTEVYRVRKEGDQLLDRYDWYSNSRVILGWSPLAGKVAVLAIHDPESAPADQQIEFTISLGGKLLKAWTTAELQQLGAQVAPRRSASTRCEFNVVGCEQIPSTIEYVFVVSFGKKSVSFDILTGNEHRK